MYSGSVPTYEDRRKEFLLVLANTDFHPSLSEVSCSDIAVKRQTTCLITGKGDDISELKDHVKLGLRERERGGGGGGEGGERERERERVQVSK